MINSYKSLCIIITILLSTFAVSAQDNNDLSDFNYPQDFTIKFPLGDVTAGQTIEISVLYKKNPLQAPLSNFPMKWSVTNGTIIEGQGTPTIKVQTDEKSETLEARIEISDVNPIELVIATSTLIMEKKPEVLEAVLFATFRYSDPNDMQMRFRVFANELNNKPSAQGYIFIQPKNAKDADRIKKIIEDYGQRIDFDISRITIKYGEKNKKNIVWFYVVPQGAKTPNH